MERPHSVHIETRSDSHSIHVASFRNGSPSALPTEWRPSDYINEAAATVRSISPVSIVFPTRKSPKGGSIDNHSIEKEWRKLQTLRAYTKTLRSKMESLSDRLQQIQIQQSEADNTYLSLVRRKHVAGECLDGAIEHAFERLESSRFEYSEVDAECESLREPLRTADYKQMRMEHRFYKNLEKLSQAPPGARIHWSPSTTSVSSKRSSEYGPEKTYHPLWEDYLSKTGLVDMLQEEFADLENWKVELEDEKELRRGIGKTLLSEDEEFLLRFPQNAEKLLGRLHEARVDAEKARVICIEAGVWHDESSSEGESFSDNEFDAPSDISFDISSPPDQHSRILGSQEDNKEEAKDLIMREQQVSKSQEQSGIISSRSPSQIFTTARNNSNDFSEGFLEYIWDKKTSTGNFVNLWLLHKLQSSLVEFGLLYREAEPWRSQAGNSVWQANIASKWLDDGTSNLISATITDSDSYSSSKLFQHPFLKWDASKTPSLPKTTEEAVLGSLLDTYAKHFNSFVYSARIQPKGLLLSTTKLSFQNVDFGNFFLLENKRAREGKTWQKSKELPNMICLGRLPFPFGICEVYLMENLYRNLRLAL